MKGYVYALVTSALLAAVLGGCDIKDNTSPGFELCPAVSDPQTTTSMGDSANIIFLHHSTGGCIWGGGVPGWFDDYNSANGTSYAITEHAYPDTPYPWDNYPFDYYNIWIGHVDGTQWASETSLEDLVASYNVIVFKHCFPVSGIGADTDPDDIDSPNKTIGNYQLQYNALRTKMLTFPDVRFIVWTGAALTAASTDGESAARSRQFFTWVKSEWDEPGDNIYVWDFFELETQGGNVMLDEYASAADDSHPNEAFSARVAPFFCQRVVDVITGNGDARCITGAE